MPCNGFVSAYGGHLAADSSRGRDMLLDTARAAVLYGLQLCNVCDEIYLGVSPTKQCVLKASDPNYIKELCQCWSSQESIQSTLYHSVA